MHTDFSDLDQKKAGVLGKEEFAAAFVDMLHTRLDFVHARLAKLQQLQIGRREKVAIPKVLSKNSGT